MNKKIIITYLLALVAMTRGQVHGYELRSRNSMSMSNPQTKNLHDLRR